MLEHQGVFNLLARGERYGQQWLLKGLKPEFAQKKLYIDLLRKEFDIAIQLHHPNIVGVVSLEKVEALGSLCIVEEWIDGIMLQQWLAGKHSLNEKLHVLRQLLTAVKHCHSLQVIHRDLKPSNIMITCEGNQVRIIDFGLSDTDRYSSLKAAAGTVHYVAPEILETDGEITAQADIYSLGMIMKDMDLPKRYNNVIDKAVAVNREARFSNIAQVQEAIESARNRNTQKKWLVTTIVAVVMLCLAAFWSGYHFNTKLFRGQTASIARSNFDSEQHHADSLALASDTTLTTMTVAEKGLKFFYPKPGVALAVSPIAESDAVDLGLSVDWAPCNIGAERTMGRLMPGAFLRTMPNPYQVLNYGRDYPDSIFVRNQPSLEGSLNDVAVRLWYGRWRLPLNSDFYELIERCQWQYIEPPSDLPGYLVTGPNGNRIFLPLGGFLYGTHYFSIAERGYYWSSSLSPAGINDPKEWALVLDRYMVQIEPHSRLNGFLVRPVIDKRPQK